MENNENSVQNQVNEVQKEQNTNQNNNGSKKVAISLIVIILILVLAIGIGVGFLWAGKIDFSKSKNNTTTNNTVVNNVVENKSGKKIDESKPWVYDAEYGKNKAVKKSSIGSTDKELIVPFININSAAGEKANKEIEKLYNEVYEKYGSKNEYNAINLCSLEYKFYVNGNILSVLIRNNNAVENGGAGRCPLYIYNFNLDTLEGATTEELIKHAGYSSISEVNDIINKWVEAKKKENDDFAGTFEEIIKDKYFIDGNDKLNFVYIVSAAGKYDTAQVVEKIQENQSSTEKEEKNTNAKNDNTSKAQQVDYSVFSSYKGRTYRNEDFNTKPEGIKENCELKFDENGKPTIKIGYTSDKNTECYFYSKEISNLKSEGAAGTTYVTFDFTAWTAGGDTTGSATISFSNVSEDYTITVSAKVNNNTGTNEYKNITVKQVGQTAMEKFVFPEFKNRVYEGKDDLTGLWYKLEFDENGKTTITITGDNKEIVDKYTRFTDVYSEGAAGTIYINFSYRLENEMGEKVQGTLGYSNNTDNSDLQLKLNNTKTFLRLNRVK